MSASPDDPQPVFDLIVRRARELCDAAAVGVHEFDGAMLTRAACSAHAPEAMAARLRPRSPAGAGTVPGRVVLSGAVVQIADVQVDLDIIAAAHGLGARSVVAVPILSDGQVIGVIWPTRFEVRPVSARARSRCCNPSPSRPPSRLPAPGRQRALRGRTTDLQEALEQQTATAELLQVINTSQGNLTPVFDRILEQAHSLCGTAVGSLMLY